MDSPLPLREFVSLSAEDLFLCLPVLKSGIFGEFSLDLNTSIHSPDDVNFEMQNAHVERGCDNNLIQFTCSTSHLYESILI